MSDNSVICLVLVLCAVAGCIVYFKIRMAALKSQSTSTISRLQNALAEYQKIVSGLQQRERAVATAEENEKQRRAKLEEEYQAALEQYNRLQAEVQTFEENLEDISVGLYKPHFSFQASTEYRTALENLREQEHAIIKAGNATTCPLNWSIGNNRREGERLVKLTSKAMLRAFNGECEAALANISWNNITKMEERIRKSYTAIND